MLFCCKSPNELRRGKDKNIKVTHRVAHNFHWEKLRLTIFVSFWVCENRFRVIIFLNVPIKVIQLKTRQSASSGTVRNQAISCFLTFFMFHILEGKVD